MRVSRATALLLAAALLGAAARRGRRVRLVIPRRSDHRLLDFARRWYLRTLHEAGAEILFFKPDVLHAKLVVVDGATAVIGSANLDMRSLFLNYEVGAVLRETATVRAIEDYVAGLEPECARYSEDLYRRSRTWQGRLGERLFCLCDCKRFTIPLFITIHHLGT